MMPEDHVSSRSSPQLGASPSECAGNNSLQLLLVGDCMLGRLVNEVLENAPPEYPWGDTLPVLQSAEWRLC
jgi:hypothetical protein